MNTSIKWYQSKTVWFNIVVFIGLVLALPQFISVIPPIGLPWISLLAAVGNLILRVWFTTQPVSSTGN